jgi:hypothetical protein
MWGGTPDINPRQSVPNGPTIFQIIILEKVRLLLIVMDLRKSSSP